MVEDHVRARVYEIGTCSGSISRVRHVLDDGARGGGEGEEKSSGRERVGEAGLEKGNECIRKWWRKALCRTT